MKTTATLIRENAKYVRQTGYDLPGHVAELAKRAHAGEPRAAEYMGYSGGKPAKHGILVIS